MKYNPNSRIQQFIEVLVKFIGLNLVFLIMCIPIFTIGAAITSLYTVVLRFARGDGDHMVTGFFVSFKENFKSSIVPTLIYLGLFAIILFNLAFWLGMKSITGIIFVLLFTLLFLLYFLSLQYFFPLRARFENSVKRSLKNSLLVGFGNFKSTLFLLLINAFVLTFVYFSGPLRYAFVLFFFPFLAYCQAFILNRVFKQYEN